MINQKKYLYVSGLLLFISLVGFTYSFFNYIRTGLANTVQVGNISFESDYESINLQNIFPISREEVDNDNDNVGIINISIRGYTTYEYGLKYTVTAEDVNAKIGNKEIPIGIKVTTTDLPSPTVVNYTDKDLFESGSIIVRGEIPVNTEVDGVITIKAFIDIDHIAVSDTYDGTESDNMGTTNDWVKDRIVLTTSEWNSFSNTPFSFKIKVETVEKYGPVRQVGIEMLSSLPSSNYYGTSYTYDEETGLFTLSGTVSEIEYTSANINSIIGKYTCEINELGSGIDIPNPGSAVDAPSILSPKVQMLDGNNEDITCARIYYIKGQVDGEDIYIAEGKNNTIKNPISELIGTNYAYADDYEEGTNGYVLDDSASNLLITNNNKNNIIGKYTCFNENQNAICEDVYYISNIVYDSPIKVLIKTYSEFNGGNPSGGIGSTKSFLIKPKLYKLANYNESEITLLTGKLLSNYAYGTSYIDNGDSFTLSGTIENIDYNLTNKNNVIGKYTCFNENPCETLYYLDSYIPYLEVDEYQLESDEKEIPYNNQAGATRVSCFTFTESDDSVIIDGYNESCGADVVIPSKIGGKTVTIIGPHAFSYKQLTSVAIPNSVTSIGNYAFSDNSLTNITIPNSVTTIGPNAFSNNSLTNVTISNSVTTIGFNAFSNNSLTSVAIPNSVTTIENSAFSGNSITSLTIGNNVTTIGNSAFSGNQLTSLTIGNSVTTIGNYAFSSNQLTSLTIGNSVTTISNSAFSSNPITTLNIDMTDIPQYFFSTIGLQYLTSLSIGNNVTTIGSNAFVNNPITTLSINMTNIPDYFYSSINHQLTSLTIGDNVTTIGHEAFKNNSLTNVTIPNSVTTIGNSAFSNNSLTNVTIPNSVTTIGHNAFSGNSITSLTIPNSVTVIGSNAFSGNSITTLNIDMPNIPDNLLSNNGIDSVRNLTIGNSVTTIGYRAFYGNPITTLNIDMPNIPDSLLSNNGIDSVKDLTIGNSVTTIGSASFSYNSLTSLIIGNNVITIGYGAFQNNSLTNVTIPNSVTTIGDRAFSGSSLTGLIIGNSVTSIGNYAFSDNQLTSLTIGSNVTSIGIYAFRNNNLTRFTINKSCAAIKSMSYYSWGVSENIIYGSNNVACN